MNIATSARSRSRSAIEALTPADAVLDLDLSASAGLLPGTLKPHRTVGVYGMSTHEPTKANFKAEPKAMAMSGDYVVDHHREYRDVPLGRDITWCLVFRFENGKIKEVTNLSFDQHAANPFFWSVSILRPIPQRLA